jgi:hypothetical protein
MDSDGNIVPDPVGWRRYQSGDRWICSYRAKVDLGNGLAAVASEHILEDELNIDQDRGKQAIENIVADRIRSLQAMHS